MGGHDPKQPSEPGETAPEIPYATKRNPITGAITVHFQCRRCGVELHAPLDDCGKRDECPQCGTGFIVPGDAEKVRRREAQARKAEDDKRRMKEAAKKIEAAHRDSKAKFIHRNRTSTSRHTRSFYPTAVDRNASDLTSAELVNVIARGIVKGWIWIVIITLALWLAFLLLAVFLQLAFSDFYG